ncbi:MAG: hypothetical protein PHU46_15960 [Rhodocyclaceae bacterium]|nr:hypothetical protein [Rhodocyclaceae bacterium]
MSAITFDTLKFVKRLEAAGASSQLAEALAQAQQEVLAEALENQLATKADVLLLKKDIEILRTEMLIKMAELKADTIKWMVGLSLAQIGLLIGILLKIAT